MDLANSLFKCSFSTRLRSVRVLITLLVVPTGILTVRNLMPEKCHPKKCLLCSVDDGWRTVTACTRPSRRIVQCFCLTLNHKSIELLSFPNLPRVWPIHLWPS